MAGKNKNKADSCGERLRIARLTQRMTQVDLAAAMTVDHGIKIDQHAISAIERDARSIKHTELIALADVLDVNALWVLYGDNVPKQGK